MKSSGRLLVLIIAVSLLIKLAIGYALPITEDEAYYTMWSRYPAWGYLDHPPFVAVLTSLWSFVPAAWAVRLPGILMSIAALWLFFRLAKHIYIQSATQRLSYVALIIFSMSMLGLLFGVIITPDVAMIFFWIFCLHEAAFAIDGQKHRWLTVGLGFAAGMLSKFTMVLMAPVLFLALLIGPRQQLRQPWPYIGFLVGVLGFLPHLGWNAQHNWQTIGFQLKRGLENSHDVASAPASLPEPIEAEVGSATETLGKYFDDPEFAKKPPKERTELAKLAKRIPDFVGGQAGIWGAFLILLLPFLFRARPFQNANQSIQAQFRSLVAMGTLVPLVFFATINLFTKVEANWPVMYGCAAALWLAPVVGVFSFRQLIGVATINCMVVLVLLIHANYPFLPTKPQSDRVLKETTGYRDMAAFVADHYQVTKSPILFDSYQIGSMIGFYQPELTLQQWPGITRLSEFSENSAWHHWTYEQLVAQGNLALISTEQIPPEMPGYEVAKITELRNCLGRGLVITEAPNELVYQSPCPEKTVKRWFLAEYTPTKEHSR